MIVAVAGMLVPIAVLLLVVIARKSGLRLYLVRECYFAQIEAYSLLSFRIGYTAFGLAYWPKVKPKWAVPGVRFTLFAHTGQCYQRWLFKVQIGKRFIGYKTRGDAKPWMASFASCGFMARFLTAAIAIASIFVASTAFCCDRCGLFGNRCAFKQVQAVVHQPIYAQPYAVNYFVGAPVRVEALVTKALRDDPEYQDFQRFRLWKSTATGDPVAPSLPLTGKPDLVIAKKCASCHTGDDAAGGLILDGSHAITDATYRRFSRMYVLGEKVPVKMRALLTGLKDAEGSAILAELLKLEPTPATAADSQPPEPQPDPVPGELK